MDYILHPHQISPFTGNITAYPGEYIAVHAGGVGWSGSNGFGISFTSWWMIDGLSEDDFVDGTDRNSPFIVFRVPELCRVCGMELCQECEISLVAGWHSWSLAPGSRGFSDELSDGVTSDINDSATSDITMSDTESFIVTITDNLTLSQNEINIGRSDASEWYEGDIVTITAGSVMSYNRLTHRFAGWVLPDGITLLDGFTADSNTIQFVMPTGDVQLKVLYDRIVNP